MKPRKSLAALLATATLSVGCAQNPVTGQSDFVLMGEDQELAIGRQSHGQILEQYGAYEHPVLQQYVQSVGERLAAKSHRSDLVYRFTVVDSEIVKHEAWTRFL